ncbi:MAG: hypothetical protein K1Y36_22945 [Blastocatellia bacterium]|nr:hypothetical protein [Blastocatellia bacterium]
MLTPNVELLTTEHPEPPALTMGLTARLSLKMGLTAKIWLKTSRESLLKYLQLLQITAKLSLKNCKVMLKVTSPRAIAA